MNDELLSASPLRAASPNPFLSLTTELKQAIFSELADTNSLKSLALTCSSYFQAFLNAKSLIIKSVLHTHIGSDLIYDALIVWKSKKTTTYDDDAANEILDSYVKRDLPTARMWRKMRLRDAEAIGDLYDQIEDFSSCFISSALGTSIVTGLDDPSPSSLSLLESARIKRTFYRFELLCKVFGQRYRSRNVVFGCEEPLTNFFLMSRPWENEQLRCIREHLFDRLSLHLDEIPERSLEWGNEINVPKHLQYVDRENQYVTPGLTYLHRLVKTFSYEDHNRLLKPLKKSPNFAFIHAFVFESTSDVVAALGRYSEGDINPSLVGNSAYDGDKGPEEAWRWTFTETINSHDLYQVFVRQKTLRKRGYVMWEYARLVEWGLLGYNWRELPYGKPYRRSWNPVKRRYEKMLDSQR